MPNMMFQGVFRSSWLCLLIISFAACSPVQKGHAGGFHSRGVGHRRGGTGSRGVSSFSLGADGGGSSGFNTGSGSTSSFSGAGFSATQDAGIAQMIANLLALSPDNNRPLLQSHWSSPQVPLGMVATRPVYPSSLIVHTNNGYQRARDFRSDSKYTQDVFDNIPQPGMPQNPGTGSKGH